MGSDSDWETMKPAVDVLEHFDIPFDCLVMSAHRTPERTCEYARMAEARGLKVIIAGAGGAAHLPGVVAAHTTLPVLGVPVESAVFAGLDSVLSMLRMPGGVPTPVSGVGKSGAKNAALFAVSVLGLTDDQLDGAYKAWREEQGAEIPRPPHAFAARNSGDAA